mmetsp:Transcript_26425/g.67225  ORF Transcript_26425/g.67225 Transcript_26425/m.67225 type:complete len:201 (-) Transcript_26425:196-798(-)
MEAANRSSVLTSAATSLRSSVSVPKGSASPGAAPPQSALANSTLSAVAMPSVCSLPHSLHFSHPTQSMIRVMFLKAPCISASSCPPCSPFHSRPSSNGSGHAPASSRAASNCCMRWCVVLSSAMPVLYWKADSRVEARCTARSMKRYEKYRFSTRYASSRVPRRARNCSSEGPHTPRSSSSSMCAAMCALMDACMPEMRR